MIDEDVLIVWYDIGKLGPKKHKLNYRHTAVYPSDLQYIGWARANGWLDPGTVYGMYVFSGARRALSASRKGWLSKNTPDASNIEKHASPPCRRKMRVPRNQPAWSHAS